MNVGTDEDEYYIDMFQFGNDTDSSSDKDLGPVHTTTTENALKLQRETFRFSMRSHVNENAYLIVIY